MSKSYTFASNLNNFRDAAIAKYYHGPLNTAFSTPSIEIDTSTEDIGEQLFRQFPTHEAFCGSTTYFYKYNRNGEEIT